MQRYQRLMKLNFERRRRRCGAPRSSNAATISFFQGTAEQLPGLRFKVLFESQFPGMLLLNGPIGFLRDPIPYSAQALMVHEVCNKGLTKPILDLFGSWSFYLASLFDKNSLCSSYRELSSEVTSIFGPNVVQTIG
jgi:hypothetical protein